MTEPVLMELIEQRNEVVRMQKENDAAISELTGNGSRVDQGSIAQVRLMVFVEMALGEFEGDNPTADRVAYERACAERFKEIVNKMRSEINRAKLLQGVNMQGFNGQPGR